MNSFNQFLDSRGLKKADLSSEELVCLKKEHDHWYRKQWRAEDNKTHKRRSLRVSRPVDRFIEKEANRHGLSFSGYMIALAEAQSQRRLVTPISDQQVQQDIRILLKKYGVNLNQIAHRVNQRDALYQNELIAIQRDFSVVEKQMLHTFNNPIDVVAAFRSLAKREPQFAKQILMEILNSEHP